MWNQFVWYIPYINCLKLYTTFLVCLCFDCNSSHCSRQAQKFSICGIMSLWKLQILEYFEFHISDKGRSIYNRKNWFSEVIKGFSAQYVGTNKRNRKTVCSISQWQARRIGVQFMSRNLGHKWSISTYVVFFPFFWHTHIHPY